ncbi:sugar ABC transporter permease [Paraburkholderia monticola]|uniref:Sugar ABC transporter permease n=1 Tax=Paraburkholderia monticola TaxID=1399968 RepID=A0A149PKN8_9BURK|nr:carbohydrate ABC transporter permease [Paraburkholderia monticola]KXU85600.1 sugar ABC transporter permease [Paraburkholderia monticola]
MPLARLQGFARRSSGAAVRGLLRLAALAVLLLPCVWMAGAAFMPTLERLAHPLALWPSAPTFEHFAAVWESGMAQSVLNSVWVALGATLLALALAFPAAYALARLAFPARLDLLFLMLVLALKLMPPITVAVPLFSLAKWLHLLDSLFGLILVYQLYALPMAIWMLLPFVRDVPIEFEEAAALDGANLAQRIVFIVVPLCAPGLVATAIFVFILAWNEFLLALLFVSSPSHFTLPLAMAGYVTENGIDWGELMSAGLISSVPTLLLAGYVQRYLLQGFSGGLK